LQQCPQPTQLVACDAGAIARQPVVAPALGVGLERSGTVDLLDELVPEEATDSAVRGECGGRGPVRRATLLAVGVRRVGGEDRDLVRELRLRALLDSPDAFGSTYEREAAFPLSVWDDRVRAPGNAHFLWDSPLGVPSGMASVVRDDEQPGAAHVVGVWVAPDVRGTGAADGLVVAAIEWAQRAGVTTLRLHVSEHNVRAERLYFRHGFTRTGVTFTRERDGATEFEMCRALC
jgi:ribosomal protein S18 acetylase RimI-like enzyme